MVAKFGGQSWKKCVKITTCRQRYWSQDGVKLEAVSLGREGETIWITLSRLMHNRKKHKNTESKQCFQPVEEVPVVTSNSEGNQSVFTWTASSGKLSLSCATPMKVLVEVIELSPN